MEKLTSSLVKCAQTYSRFRHIKTLQKSLSTTSATQYKWEPDDLKLGLDIPEYKSLDINMKGYDVAVLEAFSKYAHNTVQRMDIDNSCYLVPCVKHIVRSLKVDTQVEVNRFNLNTFHRRIQIRDVPSPKLPILLELLRQNAPQGVTVSLKESTTEEDEFLYVPNYEKEKLQEQLEELGKL